MQQAMARQAEAERNRRAKVINAEGEFQAADRLSQAADVIRPNRVSSTTYTKIATAKSAHVTSPAGATG